MGELTSHVSADAFVRPIGSAPGSARLAWQLAQRRIKAEQLRQRGWVLLPGYFETRRRTRLRYVDLYKRAQGGSAAPELTDAERQVSDFLRTGAHSALARIFSSCARA